MISKLVVFSEENVNNIWKVDKFLLRIIGKMCPIAKRNYPERMSYAGNALISLSPVMVKFVHVAAVV